MVCSGFQFISDLCGLWNFASRSDVGTRQHLFSGRESGDTGTRGRTACDAIRFRPGSGSADGRKGPDLLRTNMYALSWRPRGWIGRVGLSGGTKTGRPEVRPDPQPQRSGNIRHYQRWSCGYCNDRLETSAFRTAALADYSLFTNIGRITTRGCG